MKRKESRIRKKSRGREELRVGLGIAAPLFGGEGQANTFGGGWVVGSLSFGHINSVVIAL